MATVHEITQSVVAIGALIGTFALICTNKLDAATGYLFIGGLLSGIGIGYVNGRKSS